MASPAWPVLAEDTGAAHPGCWLTETSLPPPHLFPCVSRPGSKAPAPLKRPAPSPSVTSLCLLQDMDHNLRCHLHSGSLVVWFHSPECEHLPKGCDPNTENRAWLTADVVGQIMFPLKFKPTLNLGMPPSLERGSLKLELVNMRSHWVRQGPKPDDGVLMRRSCENRVRKKVM